MDGQVRDCGGNVGKSLAELRWEVENLLIIFYFPLST